MKMIIIIVGVALSILASLVAIIILALSQTIFQAGFTTAQIVLFGLLTGTVTGFAGAYFLVWYIIQRAKKFLYGKLASALTFCRRKFLSRLS